jgi:hypothetical protein
VLVPLAEGAATVPGGLPARLAHLQGPRVLGAGAGEPLDVDDPLGRWREIDRDFPVATNDFFDDDDDVGSPTKRLDDDATPLNPVAPGTPPTDARECNAQVLRAPGGSLLMGPWRGAFGRADEPFAERYSPRRKKSGEPENQQKSQHDENEDDSSQVRRATHLRDLGVDESHAEHLAELAFCGTDDMRLDEGRAVCLELVSEDAIAGRSSRRRNAFTFQTRDAGGARERVRSAPAAPTRKVGAQRVATRRRPSASFVRARREAGRSKEGETKKGRGDVFVKGEKGFDSRGTRARGAGARGALLGARLMRPRASGSGGA